MSEERKVKVHDPVEIAWTDKARFFKAGQTATVHRLQAEKFVDSGKATIVGDKKKK